jgi:hypothetical protein
MKRIKDCVGHPLCWQQPKLLRASYELVDGSETVASLHQQREGCSLATAETADGAWTFKRVGFFHPRVTVRVAGAEREIAQLVLRTWRDGGTLSLPGGRRLQASSNLWQTRHAFSTEAGEELIRYQRRLLLKMASDVQILPAAAALPELPWLVCLGWYLAVMMEADSGVGAVTG